MDGTSYLMKKGYTRYDADDAVEEFCVNYAQLSEYYNYKDERSPFTAYILLAQYKDYVAHKK